MDAFIPRQLSSALANLRPSTDKQNMIDSIKTVLNLSDKAWFFKSAFGVLDLFKESSIYRYIKQRVLKNKQPNCMAVVANKNLHDLIADFLEPKEKLLFSNLHFMTRNACRWPTLTNTLLTHVIKRNKVAIENLLRKEPNLLKSSGRVIDDSGRIFHNVTALQYVLWASDSQLCEHILDIAKYNNTEERMLNQDLLAQYKDVEEKGLEYTLNGQKITEKYFDLAPLMTALQTHLDAAKEVQKSQQPDDISKLNDNWINGIGYHQGLLPRAIIVLFSDRSYKYSFYVEREYFDDNNYRARVEYIPKNWFKNDLFHGKRFGIIYDSTFLLGIESLYPSQPCIINEKMRRQFNKVTDGVKYTLLCLEDFNQQFTSIRKSIYDTLYKMNDVGQPQELPQKYIV